MSNYITKDVLAKIAISKNLIKEYKTSISDRTVYLNNGTEFQIYLKNPYQTHLGIKISVNNKSIGNMLVLRPGQSFWLDRFLNENSKFLFNTYEIENTAEMKYATNNNGKVKIEFYHEREEKPIQVYSSPKIDWTYLNGSTGMDNSYINTVTCQSNLNSDITTSCYYSASTDSALKATPTNTAATRARAATKARYESDETIEQINGTIETGRVEKGGHSNQVFDYCDIDFDYYPFKTENILILPNSRKQVRVEDTRRRYCSQCGKKVSPKDKFCSNCGSKLN